MTPDLSGRDVLALAGATAVGVVAYQNGSSRSSSAGSGVTWESAETSTATPTETATATATSTPTPTSTVGLSTSGGAFVSFDVVIALLVAALLVAVVLWILPGTWGTA